MKINVIYFAILQDERGLAAEALETNATNPGDLYSELKEAHGFSLTKCRLKVAVNDEFATWDSKLSEDDNVVFIPPVAGG